MKIAIHHRKNSFSEGWIQYCKDNNIEYIVVSAYDNDILQQLRGCDWFMWHHSHTNYKDKQLSQTLLLALSNTKIKVFPDVKTTWHFDNKLAQKYLFESVDAPLVPSYVFYDKKTAEDWAKVTTYPKVFKLKGGAGSSNVKMVKSKKECLKLIRKSFSTGFVPIPHLSLAFDQLKLFARGKAKFRDFAKYIALYIAPNKYMSKMLPKEKGYAYFQDFVPNNDTDTRIVVIGDKIIGERRAVRKGDFRASGSNSLLPDHTLVDINCVKIAYQTSLSLNLQVGVFDFVHIENSPLLVEVSYGTSPDYTECEGYWDDHFNFHESFIDLPKMIIESLIK